MDAIRCEVAGGDRVGRGPVWVPAEGRLYWFDVAGPRLCWLDPAAQDAGTWTLELRGSAAMPLAGGGLLLATEKGLGRFDPATGELLMTDILALGESFRSHEGRGDPWGRFWWASIQDAGLRPGSVMLTERDKKTVVVLGGIHAPGGLAFSPDAKTLYVADGKLQTVFAHNLADLADIRLFASLQGQPGTIDGIAVDAEGFVWTAQPGASRIVRYAPDGALDRTVPLPVSHPTGLAFGGPELKTLYVTSRRDGVPPQALERQPTAGGLFAFEPGVAGLALPPFDDSPDTAH